MKTVVFIIPQLLTEETECYVEQICFFEWHFGKKMHGLRLQNDVYKVYRSQNYKQVYFSPQTADVGLVGFGLSESSDLMTFVRLGPQQVAAWRNTGKCYALLCCGRQTPSPSRVIHIMTLIIMNQNETARKRRRRLRKERPSVRPSNKQKHEREQH